MTLSQLTPLLLLLLLYGLCPQHFPPSPATTALFILYAIAAQLVIHRTATVAVLFSLAHLSVAVIYTLYYTAQAIMCAQNALFAYFERVHFQIHQLANLPKIRYSRVPAPVCSTLPLRMLYDDESVFSETNSLYSSKSIVCYRELSSNWVSPSFETRGHLPFQPYPIIWFFSHLFNIIKAVISCASSTLLSMLSTVKLLHETTISSICLTGTCLAFITTCVKPYLSTSLYLAKLSVRHFPTFTFFVVHLSITTIVLSLGERNALGLCLLAELWLLSRLDRL
ncbi:hypothetical protein ACQKWADRAFT_330654 [Trichoderma austrokoningii]